MLPLADPQTAYNWIVIGGGIAGAALGYELTQVGYSVLVIDHGQWGWLGKRPTSDSATRYSYGGLANWAGTSPLTCDLYETGMARHRLLSDELGVDTHFREIPLVMPIAPDADPTTVAMTFAGVAQPPQWLSRAEAQALEPLLKASAIGGAFVVTQGQVDPDRLTAAYWQAMGRQGGKRAIATVQGFVQTAGRVTGVVTSTGTWQGENVVICAGGWSRALLAHLGVRVPLYFTHAEIVELPPTGVQLRTMVMTVPLERVSLEMAASAVDRAAAWEEPGQELVPPVMDAGAVQFQDGTIRLGQLSRALSDPAAQIDPGASEATIRTAVGQFLPALQALPGTWHHCLVAFSRDRLPLIGPVPGFAGLHLFTGFSTPLVALPTLAQRYAHQLAGTPDPWLPQMAPDRWLGPGVAIADA